MPKTKGSKNKTASQKLAELEQNRKKHSKCIPFYDRLNELVEEKKSEGITYQDIAWGISNMSDSGLAKWTNAESEPKVSALLDMAKYFDVSLDYLCGLSSVKKYTDADITASATYTGLSEKALENIHSLQNEVEYADRLIDILNALLSCEYNSLYNLLTCVASLKNAEIKLNSRIMIAEDNLNEGLINSPDIINTSAKQLKLSYFESDESFKNLLEEVYHVNSSLKKAEKVETKLSNHTLRRNDKLSKVDINQFTLFDSEPQRSE